MSLRWIHEAAPRWDADKARIVGGAPAGIFDQRYAAMRAGDVAPGEWWRVEDDGKTAGYGWLDLVWGDAEILLATDPVARRRGVGSFILERLGEESRARGVNHMYNRVRETHPDAQALTRWLFQRGFAASSEDGRLLRAEVSRGPRAGRPR